MSQLLQASADLSRRRTRGHAGLPETLRLVSWVPYLDAEFISPKTVYTFSSTGESRIPKGVKRAHSATKLSRGP